MTIFEKLELFFKHKGITINKVSSTTGISPGLLSKGLKKEGASLGSEKIIRLLEYFPDLSAEWLMRGQGSMVIDDVQEVKSYVGDCSLCKEKDRLVESYQQQLHHLEEEIEWLRKKLV